MTIVQTPDWAARDHRWDGIESRWIEVDGVDVHGLWRDGAGTPQLLVHGLGGASTNWLDVIGDLSHDGPVLAVDLPGFGRTEPSRGHDVRIARQRRFLGRLLDVLGWDRVSVHGNSMGGLLATLLTASRPAQVESLVLCSPALPGPRSLQALRSPQALRLAPFLSASLGTRVLKRAWDRLDAEALFRQTEATVLADVDSLRDSMRRVGVENVALGKETTWRVPGFAAAASDMLKHLARRDEIDGAIEAIACPTLLVWGEADLLVSGATIDRVIVRRPDWTRIDLSDVGHTAMLESPDRYLTTVRSWRAMQDLPVSPA